MCWLKGSLLKLIKLNKTLNTDLGSTVISNRGNRSTLIFVHMILLHHFSREWVGWEHKWVVPQSWCCSGPGATFLHESHIWTYFLHFSILRGRWYFQSHHLPHSKFYLFPTKSISVLLPPGTTNFSCLQKLSSMSTLSHFLPSFPPSIQPPLSFMNVLLCLLSHSHFLVIPEPVSHLFDYKLSWITFPTGSSVIGSAQYAQN